MSSTLDNALALRVLYILITPFIQTDAYKYGIIDSEGKPLKKVSSLKSQKEITSYTMLHRLVFRLKRVLGVLPFGKTNFASYVAAYQLVKESLESGEDGFEDNSANIYAEEIFISLLNEVTSEQDIITEKAQLKKLFDDVAGNSVAGVEGFDAPIKFKKVHSKSVFKRLPKVKNTVYKVNEDFVYITEE